jgi:hypothetical protein
MNKAEAEIEFNLMQTTLNPQCPLPMNKQRGCGQILGLLLEVVHVFI